MSETIYHYCSPDSFHKIISGKSIRLSSLLLSNDSREGSEAIDLIKLFIESGNHPSEDKNNILIWLEAIQNYYHGIGFCLSEAGDLLSQWRGYADDGKGFSIGFSKSCLEDLSIRKKTKGHRSFSLTKINYEGENYFTKILPIIQNLRSISNNPKYKTSLGGLLSLIPTSDLESLRKSKEEEKNREFLDVLFPISKDLYLLKNKAFSEELEWRLLSNIEGSDYKNIECFSKIDQLIPYDIIDLSDEIKSIINQIYLGPKNKTPSIIIKNWMKNEGYGEVDIVNSIATYR
jgi:hypothetical protein